MLEHLAELKENREIFFNYMKEKYPIYYNSNLFFRDFQYAIHSFFEKKGKRLSYKTAEILAANFGSYLENENWFVRIDKNTWKMNYIFEESVNTVKESEG